MSDNFKYVEDLFNDLKLQAPKFNVSNGNPHTFSLMRLQCNGTLLNNAYKGFFHKSDESYLLFYELILKAKSENTDILLTPEYSFPFQVLTNIIKEKLYPKVGQLWCLGCEGIETDNFEKLIEIYEKEGVTVIKYALEKAKMNNFIDTLIYLFVDDSGKPYILPQLKTTVSSDKDMECEEFGMSKGNVIFKFGKGECNQLCSIICSDSLNLRLITIESLISGSENLILLHPQLNPKPRHHDFARLRNILYSNSECNNLIYITTNWSSDTQSTNTETKKEIRFEIPWSCIYTKNSSDSWLYEHRIRESNYLIGLFFGYSERYKVKIWYSFDNQNVQLILIKKPRISGACVTESNIDVLGSKLFIEDNNNWKEINYDYADDLKDLLKNKSEQYEFPLTACKQQRDKFFGICLGHFERGQLLVDENENCNIVSHHVDKESDQIRHRYLDNYQRLINILSSGNIPKYFNELVNSHQLCLLEDMFNIQNVQHNIKAIVAYVPNQEDAQKLNERLSKTIDNYKKEKIMPVLEDSFNKKDYKQLDLLMQKMRNMVCIFSVENITGNLITYPILSPYIADGDQAPNNTFIAG